jgi:type IV pilus biogenesis protein CpaD/CtpE
MAFETGAAAPVLLAAIFTAAALLAVGCGSQQEPATGSVEDIARNQPPVTAAEIPAALEFIALLNEPSETSDADKVRLAVGMVRIATSHGMTSARLAYLQLKCTAAAATYVAGRALTADELQSIGGPLTVPTPEEEAVIRPYLDALVAAMDL